MRRSGERTLLPSAPKAGTREGIYAVSDYEPSLPRAYAQYFAPSQAELWHGRLGRRKDLNSPSLVALLDRMSVRFYAAPLDMTRAQLRAVTNGRPVAEQSWLLERKPALPRTYVARSVRVEAEPDRAREAMLAGPARDVFVSAAVDVAPTAGDAAAELIELSPQRVRIAAHCERPCLVVLTDLAYPGWEASIDGDPTPTVTANLLYRAVAMPAGDHEIVHRYRPRGLRRGALAGGCLLLLLLAGAALARRSGTLVW